MPSPWTHIWSGSTCPTTWKKKYDGTNETKDDKIRVFRNYLLNTGQEELIKASMEKLKEGDIDKFIDRVVKTPGLEQDLLINGDVQRISGEQKKMFVRFWCYDLYWS